jgi:hypothetical protein
MSIAIPLCNSELNEISASRWNRILALSVCLTSGRSGGCWKDERYMVSMSTGRWSKLSAEHEARCTEEGRSLVITMSKTSGVAEGFTGLWLGCQAQRTERISRRHNHAGVSPSSWSTESSSRHVYRLGHRPADRKPAS